LGERVLTALMVIAVLIAGLHLLVQAICVPLHLRRIRRLGRTPLRYLGSASVVVPVRNEATTIAGTVRSLVGNDYPGLEVIVVDDGSADGTAAIVEALGLPGVFVIRQADAGRPAAIEAGIRYAQHDLLVLVDGGTIVEKDAIGRLLQQLADPAVDVVCGNVKITARDELPGRWQYLDHLIDFDLDRRVSDVGRCMTAVPGAIGAFRRSALRKLDPAPAGDFTMALIRSGGRVVYEPAAVAWVEAPASLRQLSHERCHWCHGTVRTIWRHRRALVRRGAAGRLGRRGLGYLLLFQVLLPLTAPLVDIYGVYGLIFLPPAQVAAVWIGFTALQATTAGCALRLGRERHHPLWALPLWLILYRQFRCLVVGRATVLAFRGCHAEPTTPPAAPDLSALRSGYFDPPRCVAVVSQGGEGIRARRGSGRAARRAPDLPA
jgi:hypothetical protein